MIEYDDEGYTPEHERLQKIAAVAKAFARIVLAFCILQAALQFWMLVDHQSLQTIVKMYMERPSSIINSFVNLINISLKGVVYWLTLKGVSLGLNMIVETDMNYRDKATGEDHE